MWLIQDTHKKPETGSENIQSKEERSKIRDIDKCPSYVPLCSTACLFLLSYWWNSDKYLGPAVFNAGNRWVQNTIIIKPSYKKKD